MAKIETDGVVTKVDLLDQAVAAVQTVFPGAEVVEVRDIPKPMTGHERWRKCWEREDREAADWRESDHPFAPDLDAVQLDGYKAAFYAQLKGVAMLMGRKPGWAAYFYKSVHGEWPPYAWNAIPPMQPSPQTELVVTARDSLYKYDRKKAAEKAEREAQQDREVEIDG